MKDKPGGSAAGQYAHSDRKGKLVFPLQQVFCRKARQQFFSLKKQVQGTKIDSYFKFVWAYKKVPVAPTLFRRGFAHRKTTIVQKSGAGPDFCETYFGSGQTACGAPARRKIRLWRILAGLEETTVVRFALAKLCNVFPLFKYKCREPRLILILNLCGRTCKVPQAPTRKFTHRKFSIESNAGTRPALAQRD